MSVLGGVSHMLSDAGQFIEPDLSSMMKMSDGIELESEFCVAHASPPRPPVPELPPVVIPPVPVVMMPVPVLPVPVELPPVMVPDPPVMEPVLPEFPNTEESPLLPQPPDSPHTTPTASMQSIVAFPYLMVIPPQ
jgi:hypothetical protein